MNLKPYDPCHQRAPYDQRRQLPANDGSCRMPRLAAALKPAVARVQY